jgi:hypothetical protein
LVVFNAGVKIKPELPMRRDRGFYFCDKAEDGQKNSFAKPSTKTQLSNRDAELRKSVLTYWYPSSQRS